MLIADSTRRRLNSSLVSVCTKIRSNSLSIYLCSIPVATYNVERQGVCICVPPTLVIPAFRPNWIAYLVDLSVLVISRDKLTTRGKRKREDARIFGTRAHMEVYS